ncbi:hypothetical protein BKA25_002676 [Actinoalloteichus hymeniacidonis]|nr:hypothetical protein [Actinoalloteichus hymeniacidonis]MBB5908360.1 hypothetical protein [Actinoalloteichus hymeniacidonis]
MAHIIEDGGASGPPVDARPRTDRVVLIDVDSLTARSGSTVTCHHEQ